MSQPPDLLPIDLEQLIAESCREKQAGHLALSAHDAQSRATLLKARQIFYAFAPHLEPPTYSKADDGDSCLADAVQRVVKAVEPAHRIDDAVPAAFEVPSDSSPRNIAMCDFREYDARRSTRVSAEMLAGVYLDVERGLIVEYAAVCRRYGHLLDGHRAFCSALEKLRHVYHGALDVDSGLVELNARIDALLDSERKRLRSVAAATGLAVVGGHASGLERLRKFSDVTYFDYRAGVVVQCWPCRALCNAHIGTLNEVINACSSTFFAPMTVAVDVLGRCFTAAWLLPLQATDSVCQLPLRAPMVRFQLERACWEANYFFTNSNHQASNGGGNAAIAASSDRTPCFDDAYVKTNAVVLFGTDARMHVAAARGLLPLYHLRHLRQGSTSSPSRSLAAMLHYFADTFKTMDPKVLASQVKAGRVNLLDDDAEGLAVMEREVLLFSSSELAKAKREKAAAARGGGVVMMDDLDASVSSGSLSSGLRLVLGTAVSFLDGVVEDVISRAASQPGAPGTIVVDVMHKHGMPLKYLPYLYARLCDKHAARVAIDSDPMYCALAAKKDSPMSTVENDLRMLNDGIRAVVTEMFARLLKHIVMHAWRRQFARRESVGSKPPIAVLAQVVNRLLLVVFPMPKEHTKVVFVPFHQRNMSLDAKALLVEGIFGVLSRPPNASSLQWDILHISPLHIVSRLCAMCDLTFVNGKVTECAPHVINHVAIHVPERVRMAVSGRQRFILTGLMEQLRFARQYTPSLLHHITLSLVDYYAQVSTAVVAAAVGSRPTSVRSIRDDASVASSAAVVNLDELLSLVKLPKRRHGGGRPSGAATLDDEMGDGNDEEALLLQAAIQERRIDLLIGAEVARTHPEFGDVFFEACRQSLLVFTELMSKAASHGAESTYAVVVARRVATTCRAIVNVERQRSAQLHAQVADANLTTSMAQHSKASGLRQHAAGAAVALDQSTTPGVTQPPARRSAWAESEEAPTAQQTPSALTATGAPANAPASKRKKVFIEPVSDKALTYLSAFVDQAVEAVQRTADKKKLQLAPAAWLYESIFEAQLCLRTRFDVNGVQSAKKTRTESAVEVAELKHAFYASVFGPSSVEAMSALVDVATARAQARDFQGALEAYSGALPELDRIKHPNRFAPANNMAYIHFALAEEATPAMLKTAQCKRVVFPPLAEEHLQKAEAILSMLVDARRRQDASEGADVVLDDLLMSDVFNNVGAVANFRRKYSVAIAAFNSSLQYSAGKLAETHPDRALAVRNIRVCKRRQMDNALYFLTLWARRFRARRLLQRLKLLRDVALTLQPYGRAFMNRRLLGRVLLYRYGGVKHTVVNAAKVLQRVGRAFHHRRFMTLARALQLKREGKVRRHFFVKREDADQTTAPAGTSTNPPALLVTPIVPLTTEALATVTAPPQATPTPIVMPTTETPADSAMDAARQVRRRRHDDQTAAVLLPQWSTPAPVPPPQPVVPAAKQGAVRPPADSKSSKPTPVNQPPAAQTQSIPASPQAHKAETASPSKAHPQASAKAITAASPAAARDALSDEAVTAYYRQRLLALYAFYGLPKKIPAVEKNLEKYKGDEANFLQALTEKYGPEPPKERRAELVAKAYEMCPTARPALPSSSAAEHSLPSKNTNANIAPKEGTADPVPPSRGSSANRAPRSERSRARRTSAGAASAAADGANDEVTDADVPLDGSGGLGSSRGGGAGSRRQRSGSRSRDQVIRSNSAGSKKHELTTLPITKEENAALLPTAAKPLEAVLTSTAHSAALSDLSAFAKTLQKVGRGLSVRLTLFKLMSVRRSMQKHLMAMSNNKANKTGAKGVGPQRRAPTSAAPKNVLLDEL